jgi:hypothetical protein
MIFEVGKEPKEKSETSIDYKTFKGANGLGQNLGTLREAVLIRPSPSSVLRLLICSAPPRLVVNMCFHRTLG